MGLPEKRFEIILSLLLITGFAVLLLALVSDSFSENQTGAFSLSFASEEDGGTGGNGSGGGSENGGTGKPSCPRADDSGTVVCVESYNNHVQCCDQATEICSCGLGGNSCIGGSCIPKPICPKQADSAGQTGVCKTQAAAGKQESKLQPNEFCCFDPARETCTEGACTSKPICVPPKYPPGLSLCKAITAKNKAEKDLQQGEFCCFNPTNQKCENGQCVVSCNDTGKQANQISCRRLSDDKKTLNKWCCSKYEVKKTLFGNEYRFFACGGKKDAINSCTLMKKLSEDDIKRCPAWVRDHGISCLDVNNLPNECPKCANGEKPDLYLMAGTVINEQKFRDFAVSNCNNVNKGNGGNCTYFLYIDQYQLGSVIPKLRGCFRNITIDSHGRARKGEGRGTQTGGFSNFGSLLAGKGTVFALSCQVGRTKNEDGIPDNVIFFCTSAPVGSTIVLSETNVCTDKNLCTTGKFSCYQCTGTRENADAQKLPNCDSVDFGVVQNTGWD